MAKSVEDMLADINSEVYLPGLQREFVWSPKQIEMLFDSLIRDYPIGLLIEWDIRRSRDNYYPYNFISNYVADNGRVPDPINNEGFSRNNEHAGDPDAASLIIDGQQRLNSLYIGLYGSIVTYTGGSGRTRDESRYWDEMKLCVNLFGHPQYDEDGLSGDYEFSFKKSEKFGNGDADLGYSDQGGIHRYWLPLSDTIASDHLLLEQSDLRQLAKERVSSTVLEANDETRDTLQDSATLIMDDFYHNIMASEIPVETVKKDNYHIKEIFQRINTQGEEPRPYQLMLSKLMSTWPYMEAQPFNPRQKVEDWIESFKHDFPGYETQIDRDLFMRYSYMLIDNDLSGKSSVNSLSETNLEKMRGKWINGPEEYSYASFEWFPRAMEISLQSLLEIGLSEYTMGSKSHIALIAKFFYENPSIDHAASETRNNIFKLFAILLLLNESHGLLRRTKARTIMSILTEKKGELDSFPALEMFDSLGVSPAREDIERVVQHANYNPNAAGNVTFTSGNVAAVLGLLDGIYGERNISNYEVDHIYPSSRADEVEEAVGEEVDIHRLGNLQLLRRSVNNGQKDAQWPLDWLNDLPGHERTRYQENNLYPESVEIEPENYTQFVENREALIEDTLIDLYVGSTSRSE